MATVETSDNHKVIELRTHYYLDEYLICKMNIEKIAKSQGCTLFKADDNYQEILVETNDFSTIFNIVDVSPRNIAIDLCVTSKGLFKKPSSHIITWYSSLDKQLSCIKKGGVSNGKY